MILIITSKRDGHVNGVATPLDKAGVPWVRVNTEDAPRNLEITLEPSTGVGTFVIKDSGCSFVLNAINAVWYRKPDPVDISHFHYRTLVLSSLAMCSERLSHRILSLESATNPEGASDE